MTKGKKTQSSKLLDWKEFEQLCFLQCSLQEIALWFHCSTRTIERHCVKHYGESFATTFGKKRVGGLITLRRQLFHHAETNVAASIFLAKNFLGMTDNFRQEHTGAGGGPVQVQALDLTDEQLAVIAATALLDEAKGKKV